MSKITGPEHEVRKTLPHKLVEIFNDNNPDVAAWGTHRARHPVDLSILSTLPIIRGPRTHLLRSTSHSHRCATASETWQSSDSQRAASCQLPSHSMGFPHVFAGLLRRTTRWWLHKRAILWLWGALRQLSAHISTGERRSESMHAQKLHLTSSFPPYSNSSPTDMARAPLDTSLRGRLSTQGSSSPRGDQRSSRCLPLPLKRCRRRPPSAIRCLVHYFIHGLLG